VSFADNRPVQHGNATNIKRLRRDHARPVFKAPTWSSSASLPFVTR